MSFVEEKALIVDTRSSKGKSKVVNVAHPFNSFQPLCVFLRFADTFLNAYILFFILNYVTICKK